MILIFLCRNREKLRSGELTVSGNQWPIFLYRSYQFDANDPWKGLLQSSILVKVSQLFFQTTLSLIQLYYYKTYKHIFTSSSSVEREAKVTKSGHAHIHGTTKVTHASIAYAATQVCLFILSFSNAEHN